MAGARGSNFGRCGYDKRHDDDESRASSRDKRLFPRRRRRKLAQDQRHTLFHRSSLSERYDSNVYFVQGDNLEDYVTTVSPQLRVVHRRQLVEGTVGGGLTAAAYVKNPGLNYVAANGLVKLNLDGAMNELVRGLGLQISDTFRYSPELPAFAAPTDGGEIPESSLIGIQARRANSFANFGTVAASYAVSPLLSFTSTYT